MTTLRTIIKRLAVCAILAVSALTALVICLQVASGQSEASQQIGVDATVDRVIADSPTTEDHMVLRSAAGLDTNSCERDIVLAFDRSGSMQEETRCFGCWEPHPTDDYPAGTFYPLPFTVVPTTGEAIHCQSSQPISYEGYQYIAIEAENYSRFLLEADYHHDNTEFPKTWWALQRQPEKNASGPDARGAWMMVGPNSEDAVRYSDIASIVHPPDEWTTPRLDYGFTVPVSGTYYVWMRAQGGVSIWIDASARRSVHVGLDGSPLATGVTPNYGPYGDGASSSAWRWTRVLKLDDLSSSAAYTLNFWAAGVGFRLDKIVITNDPRTDLDDNGHPLDWNHDGIDDVGPVETFGRSEWACDLNDPRYSPVYTDAQGVPVYDDLYYDFQPIRFAKEASKAFVRQLDPTKDQIGFTLYGTWSSIVSELYCVVQHGSCDDFEDIANQIENASASGSTDLADALWDGLRVLMLSAEPAWDPDGQGLPSKVPGRQHYGRAQVYGALILINDGQINRYPSLPPAYGNCYSDDLWPDQPGETADQRNARECAVWFAREAARMGVALHTIGIGSRAENELLAHIAAMTGGTYHFASKASELGDILMSIEAETQTNCRLFGVDVAKRVTPKGGVTVGEGFTYTLLATASGWIRPSLWLTDELPPNTVFITATPGLPQFEPPEGYPGIEPTADGKLVWQIPRGSGYVSSVSTLTVVLSATGPAGMLTNTVILANATGLLSDTDRISIVARPRPVYELRKQVVPTQSVFVGSPVTYTLVASTNRQDLDATLTDTLPTGTAFIAASGDYTPATPGPGDSVTWPLTPCDWVSGRATRTLVLSVTNAFPGESLSNTAGIAGVTDSVVLAVVRPESPCADLLVDLVIHQPDQPVTGQAINVTVRTKNAGTGPVTETLMVELYAKGAQFDPAGAPTGPADHAGGWCADPPACQHTRPEYLALLDGTAPGQSRSLDYLIVLNEADDYEVFAQVDVDQVGGTVGGYGAVLECDEDNNVFGHGTVTVSDVREWVFLPLVLRSNS